MRTVLQKGRNVALERAKPRKGRFREEIGRREAQGGRGAAGGRAEKHYPLGAAKKAEKHYPPGAAKKAEKHHPLGATKLGVAKKAE